MCTFVPNYSALIQDIVNKRRYAHHLVVEKRRKLTHVCKSWLNCLHVIRRGAVYSTSAYKGNPTTFYLRRGIAVHALLFINGSWDCGTSVGIRFTMVTDFLDEKLIASLSELTFSSCEKTQSEVTSWSYCSDGSCRGDCVGGCEGTAAGGF